MPGTNVTKTRRVLAAVAAPAAVALLAAGCSSGDGGGGGGAVTERDTEIGTVYADADGMTLYVADEESTDEILCEEGCLDFWKPVTVGAKAEPPDEFATVTRPDDGARQLTFDGKPVYTFDEDKAPGDTEGDGFADDFAGQPFTWHAVTADGTAPTQDGEDADGGADGGGYAY